MFISVVIRAEYSPYSYRANFYQQSLNACLKNNWILISNEYAGIHHKEMQEEITDRFLKEFEISKLSDEEYNKVEQYFIPDRIFDDKEAQLGSRTEMLSFLTSGEFPELENCLNDIFDKIELKHPEDKIDGVFFCAETNNAFRNVCRKRNIPLLPYLFSAIKIPHGYRQTLYYVDLGGQLFNTDICEKRYNNFLEEKDKTLPIFSHQEILSIIGKERTLPLLQLINHQPQYEMGICLECRDVIPQFYNFNIYTDDDVELECEELYSPKEISIRPHAWQLDHMNISRAELHNDAAPFILSCKRLTSVRSQITLKNLLWKRTAVMKKKTLDFSFMCANDYSSTEIVDIKALNYYVFAYLIPNDLMFSDEYWKWRMSNPKESEIYAKHLKFYIEKLQLPENLDKMEAGVGRLEALLKSRYCDREIIKDVIEDNQDFDIDYYAATSKFTIAGKSHWRLNKLNNEGLLRCVINTDNVQDGCIEFYPLDDVAGFTELLSVSINGKSYPLSPDQKGYLYMAKVNGHYTFTIEDKDAKSYTIECIWRYQKVFDYLNTPKTN